MTTPPPRLRPLLDQFDFARERLLRRLTGPVMDSGDGTDTRVEPLTDEEYFWEPVPGCWSVRRRADGPGPRATLLAGGGTWGRDAAAYPHPWPPPVTTLAWRLSHLTEMLALRTDHTAGSRSATREEHPVDGDAAGAVAAFADGAAAWRQALLGADDAALDTVGYCGYPYGSDAEEPFLDIVWWVNQEVLHHGAEIALLRDLYRAGRPAT
ncbi:DinB family protein [Streptomyces sp. NPDC055966]|uniref:DinB family protein n=1 Tax=Streptomyces sp. NPDC055966 TaxID=3345669 RepID=UPI0035D54AB2